MAGTAGSGELSGRPPLTLLAPCAGVVRALGDVPDEAFATGVLGPGLAIDPLPVASDVVVSPVTGRVASLHPHALALDAADERPVLVHLGVDTVQLRGEGFVAHVRLDDRVEAGQALVTWSPQRVAAGGRSTLVPVVALQAEPGELTALAETGAIVRAGQPLAVWA